MKNRECDSTHQKAEMKREWIDDHSVISDWESKKKRTRMSRINRMEMGMEIVAHLENRTEMEWGWGMEEGIQWGIQWVRWEGGIEWEERMGSMVVMVQWAEGTHSEEGVHLGEGEVPLEMEMEMGMEMETEEIGGRRGSVEPGWIIN